MAVRSVTPVLNVSDVGASFAWFEKLGWKRGFSWNEGGMIGSGPDALDANQHGPAGFGSVCSGEATIFLCRGAQGSRGTAQPSFPGDDATDGVWMSWWMESPADVDALHATAVRESMQVTHPPTNEPWGVREFHLRHPDGHTFRVSAGLGDENAECASTRVSRVIRAPRGKIYRAFLDSAAVAKWLPPQGMTGHVLAFEPRVDGRIAMSLTYDDPARSGAGKTSADTDRFQGRFAELVPDERIVWEVAFESGDAQFAGTMRVVWMLADAQGGTEVTVLCENLPPGVAAEHNEAGSRSSLANLAALVE